MTTGSEDTITANSDMQRKLVNLELESNQVNYAKRMNLRMLQIVYCVFNLSFTAQDLLHLKHFTSVAWVIWSARLFINLSCAIILLLTFKIDMNKLKTPETF